MFYFEEKKFLELNFIDFKKKFKFIFFLKNIK